MAVCVSIGSKTRGKGQGKARGECWEERIIYICCEFICLSKKFSYSEETTRVFVWFWFFDSWKKNASAARMQVDYISYSLITFNFLLVVIRT